MVDFLIIGPIGAVTYSNVFPLIKNETISIGYNRVGEFSDGIKFGNTIWFQNLIDYCPPPLKLYRCYSDIDYRKIENFDAINISRTEFIPKDYEKVMAVPVSFIEFWNPEQFEMIGLLTDNKGDGVDIFNGIETKTDERHKRSKCGVLDGKRMFNRLLIKRKKDG